MKNKKGFTLMEMLAVIVIIAVLISVAIPAVTGYMKKGTVEYYKGLEANIKAAGKDYLLDYKSLLPREIGNTSVVTGEELVTNNYIDKIVDEKGETCQATVTVEKTDKQKYKYYVCLQCSSKYTSDTKNCELVGNNNETKNYTISLDNVTLKQRVNQCEVLELPLATVHQIIGTEKTLITDKLEPNPKTIDTTILGETNIKWIYRYKNITKQVQVVDGVGPVTPSISLSYSDGTSYKARNSNNTVNITNKPITMTMKSIDYACSNNDSRCKELYPSLKGSGVKELNYKLTTSSAWQKIPTNKETTTSTLNSTIFGTVELKSIDNYENQSNSATFEIYLDRVNPGTTTVTYLGGSNSHSWKNNYKLQLNATDDTGVAYYEIYVDGVYYGTTGNVWTPPNNFSSCNVTFRAVDAAGNKGGFSVKQDIHMDTEKPRHTNWWWGSVTKEVAKLYIQTTDNASGINKVQCPTATQSGGNANWHWFTAVWDSGANAYRCDITPATFNHYNQTYLVHLYIYDNASNGGYYNQTSTVIPPKGSSMSSVVRPGDYVTYKPKNANYTSPASLNGYGNQTFNSNSYTGSWRVLYNDNTYGLQITSNDIVGTMIIRSYAGYNNIYEILNNVSAIYVDGVYATAARHIGTNPLSPGDPSSATCDFYGRTVKCWERNVYITDARQMNSATSQGAGLYYSTSSEYWLLSRQKYHWNGDGHICLADSRAYNENDPSDYCPITYHAFDGRLSEATRQAGIRPVITLKSNTLVNGSGTASNPWVIEY